jgi:hypothetical protein
LVEGERLFLKPKDIISQKQKRQLNTHTHTNKHCFSFGIAADQRNIIILYPL